MSALKTYMVVNAIPNLEEKEDFQLYISQIGKVFKKYGGEPKNKFQTVEQVMGKGGIKLMVVVEFPNAQAIEEMLAGAEFNALNALRNKVFVQEVDIMICEGN